MLQCLVPASRSRGDVTLCIIGRSLLSLKRSNGAGELEVDMPVIAGPSETGGPVMPGISSPFRLSDRERW